MLAPARRGPVGTRPLPGVAGRSAGVARPRPSSNQKVLPWPGALSTPMRPPMSSTRRLLMESPSPVPPKRRVVLPSA